MTHFIALARGKSCLSCHPCLVNMVSQEKALTDFLRPLGLHNELNRFCSLKVNITVASQNMLFVITQ